MFALQTSSLFLNRDAIQSSVGCTGRVYIQLIRPSAKKFLERSASRGLTPSSVQTSLVIRVIGTLNTE